MYKYRVTAESENGEQQSAEVYASSPEYAVAIARGYGQIPLDQPASVQFVQYSEKGEVVYRTEPTDESSLRLELLTRIADSKAVQKPFSAVFWPVIGALVVFSICSMILAAVLQLG